MVASLTVPREILQKKSLHGLALPAHLNGQTLKFGVLNGHVSRETYLVDIRLNSLDEVLGYYGLQQKTVHGISHYDPRRRGYVIEDLLVFHEGKLVQRYHRRD